MPIIERIKTTLIIASAFALLTSVSQMGACLLFHEPLNHAFWHSLVSIERLIGMGPIAVAFGWWYPTLMKRELDRKAKAEQAARIVVAPNPVNAATVKMTTNIVVVTDTPPDVQVMRNRS